MLIRDFIASDEAALCKMHAEQGFGYQLPDLLDPRLWITQKVLVDGNDNPQKAILGRLTSEVFFLDFPEQNEFTRMRRFLSLYEAACEEGRRCGMDSIHAWIPPALEEKFGNRLERLGWTKYTWPVYMRRLT